MPSLQMPIRICMCTKKKGPIYITSFLFKGEREKMGEGGQGLKELKQGKGGERAMEGKGSEKKKRNIEEERPILDA